MILAQLNLGTSEISVERIDEDRENQRGRKVRVFFSDLQIKGGEVSFFEYMEGICSIACTPSFFKGSAFKKLRLF